MSPPSLLLIEDNPDDVKLTLRAFRKCGLGDDVVIVRDGEEALDYLLELPRTAEGGAAEPAVVLLDLKLPKLGGREVLRTLRAHPRTRRLPVVALTNSYDEKEIADCYELGVNSYVLKRTDFDAFAETIQMISAYWLRLNLPPPPGGDA